MFEYYGHIHVYSPGGRGRQPPGIKIFLININLLSICILQASILCRAPYPDASCQVSGSGEEDF